MKINLNPYRFRQQQQQQNQTMIMSLVYPCVYVFDTFIIPIINLCF